MTDPDGVFVYGTLKSGERNAASVAPVFRGPAVLFKGRLFHLPAPMGYPVLYLDGPGPVHGELFASPIRARPRGRWTGSRVAPAFSTAPWSR